MPGETQELRRANENLRQQVILLDELCGHQRARLDHYENCFEHFHKAIDALNIKEKEGNERREEETRPS